MITYNFYQKSDLEKYYKYVPVIHKNELRPLDNFVMDNTIASEHELTKKVSGYKIPACYFVLNSIYNRIAEKTEQIDKLRKELEDEKNLYEKLKVNKTATFKELFEIIINH